VFFVGREVNWYGELAGEVEALSSNCEVVEL
jgi:hypothetical protein